MGLGSCLVLFGTHLRMASRLFLYVVFPDCVISFSSSDWWMGFLWALFSSLWGLSLLPFWEVAGLLVLGLTLTPWLEDPLAVGAVLVFAPYLFSRWVFSPDLS